MLVVRIGRTAGLLPQIGSVYLENEETAIKLGPASCHRNCTGSVSWMR